MSTNVLPSPRSGFFTTLRQMFSVSLPARRSEIAPVAFFLVMTVAVTFLQKFAIVIDLQKFGVNLSVGSVEIALPIFYLSLAVLVFWVRFKVALGRLLLFSLFTFSVLISLALQQREYSLNSALLVFAIYTPFVFQVDVKEATYRTMVSIFLNVMLVMGGIVILQQISQLTLGASAWPNLDRIIPDDFQFHNFNYLQPIVYGSRFMKPNAIFFLEVSLVSQWTAVALALELVFFARIWRMGFYATVLVACLAGTGLLLLAMCAPVLLGRVKIRTMAVIFITAVIGVTVAVKIHWYDLVRTRFDEYQRTGTSADHRFVEPMKVILDEVNKPGFFFTGEGPGTISKADSDTWWVVAKIAYEYGVFPTITFMAFLIYCLFVGAPSQRLAFTYAMLMNFMGGFIIPVWPLLIFILGGMFHVKESRNGRGRSGKGASGKSRDKSSLPGFSHASNFIGSKTSAS